MERFSNGYAKAGAFVTIVALSMVAFAANAGASVVAIDPDLVTASNGAWTDLTDFLKDNVGAKYLLFVGVGTAIMLIARALKKARSM